MYTRFSAYSTRSLCTCPDLFIEQWALNFALPSSNTKDTLVFVCEFPFVTLTAHSNLPAPVVISFIPFHYTLIQGVSKMHLSFSVILIRVTSRYCRSSQKNYHCELGRRWLASWMPLSYDLFPINFIIIHFPFFQPQGNAYVFNNTQCGCVK